MLKLFNRFTAWVKSIDEKNKAELVRLLAEKQRLLIEIAAFDLIEAERSVERGKMIEEAIKHRAAEIRAGRPLKVKE